MLSPQKIQINNSLYHLSGSEELLGHKLFLTVHGEAAPVDGEVGAVFQGLTKSGDDVVDIHIFCNQQIETYHYAPISNTRYQHFNQTSIHLLKHLKGQRFIHLE